MDNITLEEYILIQRRINNVTMNKIIDIDKRLRKLEERIE